MDKSGAGGRPNQRLRTRRDLMDAAQRLIKRGIMPSMEDVAGEAQISRATAYRYFSSVDALLVEASLDMGVPEVDDFFATITTDDPIARLMAVDDLFANLARENENQYRVFISQSMLQRVEKGGNVPVRQNRRVPMAARALAPVRGQMKPATFKKLVNALAYMLGFEGVTVTMDVLQLKEDEGRKIRAWAYRAMVDAALNEGVKK